MPSPFNPSGWSVDTDGTISTIALENPSGSEIIGVAEQTGLGTFIFSPSSSISVLSGERVYASILVKQIDPIDISIALNDRDGATTVDRCVINPSNGDIKRDVSSGAKKITFLGDGFTLFQVRFDLTQDYADLVADIRLRDGSLGVPVAGSKMYVQAAFFGKADDFPANVMPTL